LPTRPLTEKIDWWGLILMNAGAVAIVLMATWGGNEYAWSSPVIIVLGVAGLICWGLFAFVESRAADPILPWSILINRTFVISTIVGMLAMGGMIGVLSYLPTYLQMVYGYSATASGLLLVPITLGMLSSSILSGVLVARSDRYKVYPVLGPLVAAGASFWLSRLSTTSPVWEVSAATFVMGAGIGLFFQLLVTVVQNAVPARHLGTATSGNNFFREVGVSLGASLIGAAFSSGLTSSLADRIGALAAGSDPTVLDSLARFGDADTSSLTPALVNQLPAALRDAVASSYADALLPIFGWMIPLFAATAVIALFLPEVPLSRKNGMEQVADAEGAVAGEADGAGAAEGADGHAAERVGEQ
ncbi:MAG: MFS transporter, partial [Actinomyces sp.]